VLNSFPFPVAAARVCAADVYIACSERHENISHTCTYEKGNGYGQGMPFLRYIKGLSMYLHWNKRKECLITGRPTYDARKIPMHDSAEGMQRFSSLDSHCCYIGGLEGLQHVRSDVSG